MILEQPLTLDTSARSDLELPLGRHNLGIGSRDFDAGVQASLVVSLNDISAKNLSSTNTTVVWALRTGETIGGPSVWPIGHIEKGVFLLKTEPWFVLSVCLHQLGALVTVVEFVRGSISVPALVQDDDVGGTTERIREDSTWAEVHIGVVSRSLISRRTVKVPFWEIGNRFGLFEEGLV